MTFAIFIALFLAFFVAVLNFLPSAGTLPLTISNSIVTIVAYMKAWNFLLPISELLLAVSVLVTFEVAVWGWLALRYIVSVIRGNQSGS